MLKKTGLVISGLGLLIALFFLFNTYPVFYFKQLNFELEDHHICYKYKWDLLGFMDSPTDRKILITDVRNGRKKAHVLLTDIIGFNEVRFYRSINREYLIIEDNSVAALIDYETLELVEMGHAFEYMKLKLKAADKLCYGKVYQGAYQKGNCEIEAYSVVY